MLFWIWLATSFIIACMVLWFGFVTKIVLIIYQHFCCCWTTFAQHQESFWGFFPLCPRSEKVASGVWWINYLFSCLLNFFLTYWTVCLSLWSFFPSTFFPILQERRVSKQLCGFLTAGRSQPITNVDIREQTMKENILIQCEASSVIAFISICLFNGWHIAVMLDFSVFFEWEPVFSSNWVRYWLNQEKNAM